jgi:PcfJ-like protein
MPFAGSSEQGDYTIRELLSFRELFEEGQLMQHCVFTYAAAARAGSASIWSLRLTHAGREVSRVTVRVAPSERALVEARRRCNHAIQPNERELLQRWANSQGLSVALVP